MLKRFVFIGVLCFSMMALFQTQAWAWGFCTAGNCQSGTVWGHSYTLVFDIKGGGSNDAMEGTFVGSTLEVTKASLVCSNPGENQRDVTVGVAGITLVIDTPLNDLTTTPIDDRGRFLVNSERIFAKRDEIPDSLAATIELKQLYFNEYWMVDYTDCKKEQNKEQWNPYAYYIQSANLTGIIYTCSDPNNTNTCVPGDKITMNCSTEEDPRYWAKDGEVTYTCPITRTKK